MRGLSITGVVFVTLACQSTASADVNPVPRQAWVADAQVNDAVAVGDTVYLGGEFRYLGRRSTTGESFLDLTTGAVLSGCAQRSGFQGGLKPPAVDDPAGGLFLQVPASPETLRDGAGVFPEPPSHSFVRVGPDCRFDRSFHLGPFVPGDATTRGLTIARAGNVVFVGGSRPAGMAEGYGRVVAFDATTGARLAERDFADFGVVHVEGVAPDGRLAVSVRIRGALMTNQAVGLLDMGTGAFAPFGPATALDFVKVAGGTMYVHVTGSVLRAFDLTTGQPRVGWTDPSLSVSDLEVANGRVFVALGGGVFAGRTGVVALGEGTGALVTDWTVAVTGSAGTGQVDRLEVVGSRLFARGLNVLRAGGQPRLRLFAVDLDSGALDQAWAPLVFPATEVDLDLAATGGGLFVGALLSDQAVPRTYLGAVSASTGAVLPFDPWAGTSPQWFDVPEVTAANATHLFVGTRLGRLRRVSLSTGEFEPWTVTATASGLVSQNAGIAALAASDDRVYIGGSFTQVIGADGVAQVRNHAAAVSTGSGAVLPWNPGASGTVEAGKDPAIYALLLDGLTVVVGGNFTAIAGQTRGGLARVDAASGQPLGGFTLPVGGYVTDLAEEAGVVAFVGLWPFNGYFIGSGNLGTGGVALWQFGFVPGEGDIRPSSHVAWLAGLVYSEHEWDPVLRARTSPRGGWVHPLRAGAGLLNLSASSGDRWTPGFQYHEAIPRAVPGAPQGLAAQTSGNAVALTWNPPADRTDQAPAWDGGVPTSYVVRAGSGSGLFNLADVDTGTLATSLSATAPSGTYYVRVHGRNAFGLGPASNEVSFTLGPSACTAPPAAPGPLSASTAGLSVMLGWGAAAGATSYVLEAGSAGGASNLAVVNVGAALTFGATAPAGTYFVRVRGSNGCGNGPSSNEVSFTLGTITTLPGAPVNLSASVNASRTVSIAWGPPTGGGTPTGYVLEAGSVEGAANLAVVPTNSTGLVASGVPPGVYFVRVRATNAAGQGPATADVAITVP